MSKCRNPVILQGTKNISTLFDFRLKVFNTVARRQNFTKAAEELNITQPAVSKHIREIEQQLNTKLFHRHGTRIQLTAAGKILLKYTNQIFEIYRRLETDLNQLNQSQQGLLRIGASTTIAQYVLPPILASFHKKYPDIRVALRIHNTEDIEGLLEQGQIDLGLIEGQSKNKLFHYAPFLKDEIVLTMRSGHPLAAKEVIDLATLQQIPLLLREPGSGTLETISYALKSVGIRLADLQPETQLANTESMKLYLLNSDCAAFLSMHAIMQELKSRTLAVVQVENLRIERLFQFITAHGEQSSLTDLFLKFARKHKIEPAQ